MKNLEFIVDSDYVTIFVTGCDSVLDLVWDLGLGLFAALRPGFKVWAVCPFII